ncbi:MAG TPA: glycerate kinase [Micropepsaceae bacterium]|nr:glycerate kinase [Micropepsaceae bacterium]
MDAEPRAILLQLFHAALAAASAECCVPPHLPALPRGRTFVVGAGKAAAAMARVVEDHWQGKLTGLVVTRYGHGVPCRQIEVVEAGHPMPDEAGLHAARRILDSVGNLTRDDLVLALISGGGSALLTLPAAGITLVQKRFVTAALLRSGAPIAEINCVRKHLSAIKGGRLALAASPAPVVALIISDVPGDDPALVASGPTVPDPTTSADAAKIFRKWGIIAPEPVAAWLKNPESETPKPDDPGFARVQNAIVTSSRSAIAESVQLALTAGFAVHNLGDLEGEARMLAREHAQMALRIRRDGKAAVILSGGETTVTVRGSGRGGRNAEYLLALAAALEGADGIWALACDTDGVDGSEDNAGATIAPKTLSRAAALGLNADTALAENDSYEFFARLGDLIVTGPTRTNVNDFRAILIAGRK